MSEQDELAIIDEHGLCDNPVAEDEIDVGLHDDCGFDHSGGPGPLVPVPADE